jgi:hypothetical protein
MITLHPEILKKDGKSEFAVIPYDEFVALQEFLSDVDDVLELRAAKEAEADQPTVSLEKVKLEFGQ